MVLLWVFMYMDFLCVVGFGFGSNDADVEVSIGPVACRVESLSNTEISCVTESTSKTHHIDNSGTHPTYGKYYDWNPSLLIVEVQL